MFNILYLTSWYKVSNVWWEQRTKFSKDNLQNLSFKITTVELIVCLLFFYAHSGWGQNSIRQNITHGKNSQSWLYSSKYPNKENLHGKKWHLICNPSKESLNFTCFLVILSFFNEFNGIIIHKQTFLPRVMCFRTVLDPKVMGK